MALSNIERFDETVGKALAMLYESFPVPRHLLAEDFVGEGNVRNLESFTGAELTMEAEFCMATLLWLHETGYISAKDTSPEGLGRVVLTAKGLETLKAVPDSLQGPLGARLVEAAKTEGRELIRSLASQAISAGLQVFTR